MDKSLRRLYFDEYKQGKISSNEMCDEIVYILIQEDETENVNKVCGFIEEEHVMKNLEEKLNKKLEYLKNSKG